MNPYHIGNQNKWMAFAEIGYNVHHEKSREDAAFDIIAQLKKALPYTPAMPAKTDRYGLRFTGKNMERIFVSSKVRISEDVQSDFSDRMIPAGTIGTVVEYYENTECYAIDAAIPDENLTGGFAYENVILTPAQFIVIGINRFRNKAEESFMNNYGDCA